MEKNQRQSNFELLRIVAAMFVIILHFNYLGTDNGAVLFSSGLNKTVLLVLEAISITAVNLFLLITGYFNSVKEKVQISKIVGLIAEVIAINLVFTVYSKLSNHEMSFQLIVKGILPANYYVILYSVVLLLSPYINRLIGLLNGNQLRRLVILLFVLFSIYPTMIDILEALMHTTFNGLNSVSITGDGSGYTIVNFLLMYFIGAYLRKVDVFSKLSFLKCFFGWIISFSVVYLLELLPLSISNSYCNPAVICEAVMIFGLFAHMNIHKKMINILSSASFTCFLLQERLLAKFPFSKLQNANLLILLVCLFSVVIGIYFISFVADFLWKKVYGVMDKSLSKKLPEISVR